MWDLFEVQGWSIKRTTAVKEKYLRKNCNYRYREYYVDCLSQRIALRSSKAIDCDFVWIMEDNIAFDTSIREQFAELVFPTDWGIIYLGCIHLQTPTLIGPRVVKVTKVIGARSYIVKRRHVNELLSALRVEGKKTTWETVAGGMDDLHKKIPSYAIYPNLIWHSVNTAGYTSEAPLRIVKNIQASPIQTVSVGTTLGLIDEMRSRFGTTNVGRPRVQITSGTRFASEAGRARMTRFIPSLSLSGAIASCIPKSS